MLTLCWKCRWNHHLCSSLFGFMQYAELLIISWYRFQAFRSIIHLHMKEEKGIIICGLHYFSNFCPWQTFLDSLSGWPIPLRSDSPITNTAFFFFLGEAWLLFFLSLEHLRKTLLRMPTYFLPWGGYEINCSTPLEGTIFLVFFFFLVLWMICSHSSFSRA